MSALLRKFLIENSQEESENERGKRLQAEVLATIRSFRAGDRIHRDELHDRERIR